MSSLEKIALNILVIFVRSVAIFVRSITITALFVGGIVSLVLAFAGQPPWYSALMVIMGLAAIFLGDWLAENDVPEDVILVGAIAARVATIILVFVAGVNLVCLAFIDQPPWYSVIQFLAGVSMIFASKAYLESGFSFCAWWKEISESVS